MIENRIETWVDKYFEIDVKNESKEKMKTLSGILIEI